MAQYIDKSELVAEIERAKCEEIKWMEKQGYTEYHQGLRDAYKRILSFIDTLEVKEYSEEYDGFLGKELKMIDDEIERLEKLKVKEVDLEKEWKEFLKDGDVGFKEIAIYFFELGLRLQTETNITFKYNIGESVREYKAQKGEKV